MEAVAASGLNFMSFENDQISKLSPIQLPSNTYEAAYLSDNSLTSIPNLSSSVLLDSNSSHPGTSRAIFTILLPSSQILVVNSAACQLIDYSSDELCSMKLYDLIHESDKHKFSILLEGFYSDSDELCNSGQLLEFLKKDGENLSVFLHLKKIDNPQKCLAIAELLDERTGLVTLDQNGRILSHDEEIPVIFKYDASELIGVNIQNLLPAINIPHGGEPQWNESFLKQQITGRTKTGESFPVSLNISHGNPSSKTFKVTIWVYNSLSGLILLNRRLLISNFNNYFVKLLFGFSKKEIINQPIENLIPTFCRSTEKCKKAQTEKEISNDSNLSKWCEKSEASDQSIFSGNSESYESMKNLKSNPHYFKNHSYSAIQENMPNIELQHESQSDADFQILFTKVSPDQNKEEHGDFNYSPARFQIENYSEVKFSPKRQVLKLPAGDVREDRSFHSNENLSVQEGKFLGYAKHSDGNFIQVRYQVKATAASDENFYCVWLSQDVQKLPVISRVSTAMGSSFNTTSFDCSLPKDSVCSEQCTRPSTASIISQCDENLTAGDYSQYYTNIKQIGKGAFGYVKMAFRNSDGLLVVTKFIKKKKINIRSWVFHSNLNIKIPLEISLLITLQHPNIVKVFDVFHNDSFVQLVMEKHGAGFDLFEFINRGPKCDEKLKSYIFRQIISAVHYLDSLGILHRDIKDENVIINEKFEVKLIDFGSATFMPPDETFSKFYGTVEYCSPEVLQGNAYKGPELEIWALGVTLYVLTFGENPFYDIEETIKGHFSIPSPISRQLDELLHKMLDKNVETRITISEVVNDPWINQPVPIENYRFEEVVHCYDEEAYPPKYVYEIRSEEIYSRRDSGADSDPLAETNNSNNSLQNTTADELGDLDVDNFQDSSKILLPEPVREKYNVSPITSTSTPIHGRKDKPFKCSLGLRKDLEISSSASDWSQDCRENDSFAAEFNLNKSCDSDEDIVSPVFKDSRDLELEVRFKNCSFFKEENAKEKESLINTEYSHNLSQQSHEPSNEQGCEHCSVAEEGANEYRK